MSLTGALCTLGVPHAGYTSRGTIEVLLIFKGNIITPYLYWYTVFIHYSLCYKLKFNLQATIIVKPESCSYNNIIRVCINYLS